MFPNERVGIQELIVFWDTSLESIRDWCRDGFLRPISPHVSLARAEFWRADINWYLPGHLVGRRIVLLRTEDATKRSGISGRMLLQWVQDGVFSRVLLPGGEEHHRHRFVQAEVDAVRRVPLRRGRIIYYPKEIAKMIGEPVSVVAELLATGKLVTSDWVPRDAASGMDIRKYLVQKLYKP